ncbi:MAG: hypothetical protein P9L92_13450 [Candidatus Electryonea clarkiae]|nr:hypothetical protein [Candidatus Electryonea clarkiae]MDP8288907.1 hypothetical protein [Candidatus Electryonea clarkiae]
MKKLFTIKLWLAIWALLFITATVSATVIEVEGVAKDRETAILDAQRTAVSAVMGQYVDNRSLVANYNLVSDRILTSSQGYVQGYDVLEEGAVTAGYRVKIRANVTTSSLSDDLNAISVLQAKKGNPRFIVVPDPSPVADAFASSDPAVGEALRGIQEFLSQRGMNIVQAPAYSGRLATGSPDMLRDLSGFCAELGAEYAVYFSILGKTKGKSRTFSKAVAIANISVVHTGSYRIIAQEEGRADGADNTDIDFAYRKAAREASKKAMDKALERVLADWSRSGTTAGNTLSLNIEDVQGSDLEIFEEALERSGAVKSVTRRSFADNRAILEVLIEGDLRDLGYAAGLALEEKGWIWAMIGTQGTSLTYRVPVVVE